jgi:hypothetical protein
MADENNYLDIGENFYNSGIEQATPGQLQATPLLPGERELFFVR